MAYWLGSRRAAGAIFGPQAEGVRADGKILFNRRHSGGGTGWFRIYRVLQSEGIESYVVDPASIATSRRRRRAKTDRIDGEASVRRCWLTNGANRASAPSSARQDGVRRHGVDVGLQLITSFLSRDRLASL